MIIIRLGLEVGVNVAFASTVVCVTTAAVSVQCLLLQAIPMNVPSEIAHSYTVHTLCYVCN